MTAAPHLRLVRDPAEAEPLRSLRATVDALADLTTFEGACVVCGLTREEHGLMQRVACGVKARERRT